MFRPITQTRMGLGRGNCTEASIATLLGVALEEHHPAPLTLARRLVADWGAE